jgi:hypothetical protein
MSPRSVRSKASAKRVESQARLSNGKFVENNNVCVVKDCLRAIVNHIAFVNELGEEFVDEDGDRVLDHDNEYESEEDIGIEVISDESNANKEAWEKIFNFNEQKSEPWFGGKKKSQFYKDLAKVRESKKRKNIDPKQPLIKEFFTKSKSSIEEIDKSDLFEENNEEWIKSEKDSMDSKLNVKTLEVLYILYSIFLI